MEKQMVFLESNVKEKKQMFERWDKFVSEQLEKRKGYEQQKRKEQQKRRPPKRKSKHPPADDQQA